MAQNDYVAVIQERLDWCVQTERYEMAALPCFFSSRLRRTKTLDQLT